MRVIYNEGRVVGFSAYELFVRQHISEDPSAELPSESEWLAATGLGSNAMILKIPANTAAGTRDYQLPSNCNLCACGPILASIFLGSAEFSGNWATRITSFGKLINNTSSSSPSTPGRSSNVPYDSSAGLTPTQIAQCSAYLNVIDGICFQPGTWTAYNQHGLAKDFKPNLSEPSIIRLKIAAKITVDTYILLQGFRIRTIVKGSAGIDSSMETASPQDGDFIGPEVFPWASKIVLIHPTTSVSFDVTVPTATITSGSSFIKTISLVNGVSGADLDTSGSSGIDAVSEINWTTLLNMLKNNRRISISHAGSADTATTATTASSADKATRDGSNNVITSTYAASLGINSDKVQLKNKEGNQLSEITLPGYLARLGYEYDSENNPTIYGYHLDGSRDDSNFVSFAKKDFTFEQVALNGRLGFALRSNTQRVELTDNNGRNFLPGLLKGVDPLGNTGKGAAFDAYYTRIGSIIMLTFFLWVNDENFPEIKGPQRLPILSGDEIPFVAPGCSTLGTNVSSYKPSPDDAHYSSAPAMCGVVDANLDVQVGQVLYKGQKTIYIQPGTEIIYTDTSNDQWTYLGSTVIYYTY